MELVRFGSNVCCIGLQWKDGNPKTIRKDARDEAVLLGAGEEDSAIGYAYSINADKTMATYGLGLLNKWADIKKLGRIYALAPSLASRLDDGLYIAKLDRLDGAGVYWLVGVSGGVVLPQTDQAYESIDDLQGNIAMLRTIMPDAPVYLHNSVDEIFSVEQQEWVFPAGFPSKKDVSIIWLGSTSGGGLVGAVKLLGIVGVLSVAGWFGWGYYQSLQAKGPTPEEIAMQQAQAYDASLQEIAAEFSAASLQHKWEHMTRAVDASRLVTAGFRVNHIKCDLIQCQVKFASDEVGVAVPEHALAQMKGRLGGDAQVQTVAGSQQGGLELQWQIPALTSPSVKGPDAIATWSQNLPRRSVVEGAVKAASRAPGSSLRSFVHVVGAAEGLTAARQTKPSPPGRPAVQVLQIPVQLAFPGFEALSSGVAEIFGGMPAGVEARFDDDGVADVIVVQVFSAVQE